MPLDEGGYQAFFPYYPQCSTDGRTVEEALANAKELIEDVRRTEAEEDGGPVPSYEYATHVFVGTVDSDVPRQAFTCFRRNGAVFCACDLARAEKRDLWIDRQIRTPLMPTPSSGRRSA